MGKGMEGINEEGNGGEGENDGNSRIRVVIGLGRFGVG